MKSKNRCYQPCVTSRARRARYAASTSTVKLMVYQVFRIHLRASDLVKKLNPRHDWIVAYRVDGRLIHQVAIRKGDFHEVCSEIHSEEEDGVIVQGRLTFAKVVSLAKFRRLLIDLGNVR
jgi:hypothetical protein